MTLLTTGIIENPEVSGVRPSVSLSVLITNNDTISATVKIEGFFLSETTKVMYVQEEFILAPGNVAQRSYFANFDAFEFQFTVSSDAVDISAWGKDSAGNLTTAQRLVSEELNPV